MNNSGLLTCNCSTVNVNDSKKGYSYWVSAANTCHNQKQCRPVHTVSDGDVALEKVTGVFLIVSTASPRLSDTHLAETLVNPYLPFLSHSLPPLSPLFPHLYLSVGLSPLFQSVSLSQRFVWFGVWFGVVEWSQIETKPNLCRQNLSWGRLLTVACMTSYQQNVPPPYLITCETFQLILPHPVVHSALSRLSMVCCTISMFS